MNTEVLQEFLVKLGFKTDETQLNAFIGGVESASTRIIGMGLAITAAAVGIAKSIEGIAKEYKELDLLAKQFKSTTEQIDNFLDTNEILGISSEDSKNSLKSLSNAVSDAGLGIGRAKIVFEKLGISVTDANGKTKGTVEVMEELKTKLQGLDRATQLRIMERLGLDPKLLAVFNDALGKSVMIGQELNKIDIAAGFDLDKTVNQSKEFIKSWKSAQIEINLLKTLFTKMYEAVVVQIMPVMQKTIDAFAKAVERGRRVVMDNAKQIEDSFKPIIEIILKVGEAFTKLIGTAFALVFEKAQQIISTFLKINEATNGWAGYILAAVAAWKLLNLSFLATPLGMLIALGVGILALVDDFRTFQEGGESLIDWSNNWAKALIWVAGAIMTAKTAMTAFRISVAIGTSIMLLAQNAMVAWAATTAFLSGVMNYLALAFRVVTIGVRVLTIAIAANPIGALVTGIIIAASLIIANWDTVKEYFEIFTNWFSEKVDNILEYFTKLTGFDFSVFTMDNFKDTFLNVLSLFGEITDNMLEYFTELTGFDFSGLGKSFDNVINSILNSFNPLKDAINWVLDAFGKLTNLSFSDITSSISRMFGGNSQINNIDNTKLTPAMANNTPNVNQSTVINVTGAQSPQQTAQLVQQQQTNVNAQIVRNMRGAVR